MSSEIQGHASDVEQFLWLDCEAFVENGLFVFLAASRA